MRKLSKKSMTAIISVVIVLTLVIGATLAYLQDVTEWYSNTFQFAEGLTVTLQDEATNYRIVPGRTQEKRTSVTVSNEDVDCYLYVVVKNANTSISGKEIVKYAIADGWRELPFSDPDIGWSAILPKDDDISDSNTKIYYREVAASDEDTTFGVLQGDCVSYPLSLSKSDIPDGTQIRLNFAARVIQKEGFEDAGKAWIGEAEELPNAVMAPIDPATVGTVSEGAYGNWSGELDTAISFTTEDTAESIADKPYKEWECDFILKFNRDVEKSDVHVFGQYDAFSPDWIGGPLGQGTMRDGEEVYIIRDWLNGAMPGVRVSYSDVVELGAFNCGIAVENAPEGLVATLSLVMTDENGDVHVLNSQNITI